MFCVAAVPLEALKQSTETFLHPEEMKEFQQYTFEKKQFDYLIRQYAPK